MRKLFIVTMMVLMNLAAWAVPVKPGQWRMIQLCDGTEVRAMLCGDEHVHFWMSADGQRYMEEGDAYVAVTPQMVRERAAHSPRIHRTTVNRLHSPRRVQVGDRTHYEGKKKGLVILANFTDTKFKTANNLEKYNRILNEAGYSEGNFRGSVTDYFKSQSNGVFELDFDVVGPYTTEKSYTYYGSNDSQGNDKYPEEMVIEMCKAADEEVNFADYDWDGDGEVDQVFVVYAGKGEADGGGTKTIWPHMWSLSEANKSLVLDSIRINNYACSNEIDGGGNIAGIGTFCHEFSHCMGFPDFYDITYSGAFGMGDFDLMDAGAYNGNSFCPPNYTAHEKMMCGWLEPIELNSEDVTVENLLSMSDHGASYIIYNDAHTDEYYMIENRQQTGWDTAYPTKGMLITHVDFDKEIWAYNYPNSILTASEAAEYEFPKANNHQRMTLFHADNDDDSKYWSSYGGYYTKQTLKGDLYPYNQNNSLTSTSSPAATLYNTNSQGTKFMQGSITNIKQNSDGTMSFKYVAQGETPDKPDDPDPIDPSGDYLFYESFDLCAGTGGNDGLWKGQVASSTFEPDNSGWSANEDKAYAGNKCAKFGTGTVQGQVTTPLFTINGKATLTFKAGAWDSTKDGTELALEVNNGTITPATFTMQKGAWTDFTATIEGTGNVRITFIPSNRFFLDEVLVVDDAEATGIQEMKNEEWRMKNEEWRMKNEEWRMKNGGVYDLQGRKIPHSELAPGIYIVNGKKVMVK